MFSVNKDLHYCIEVILSLKYCIEITTKMRIFSKYLVNAVKHRFCKYFFIFIFLLFCVC